MYTIDSIPRQFDRNEVGDAPIGDDENMAGLVDTFNNLPLPIA
jgi:hypothetical protein